VQPRERGWKGIIRVQAKQISTWATVSYLNGVESQRNGVLEKTTNTTDASTPSSFPFSPCPGYRLASSSAARAARLSARPSSCVRRKRSSSASRDSVAMPRGSPPAARSVGSRPALHWKNQSFDLVIQMPYLLSVFYFIISLSRSSFRTLSSGFIVCTVYVEYVYSRSAT
jgi:hypothetical protein